MYKFLILKYQYRHGFSSYKNKIEKLKLRNEKFLSPHVIASQWANLVQAC